MDIKQLITYINRLWTETVSITWRNLSKHNTDRIVKAIQDKEYETVNPSEISSPIVDAVQKTTDAIKNRETVKEVSVKNIQEARSDFSEVVNILNKLLKKEKNIVIKQGKTSVNIDTKKIIKGLKRIEKKIEKSEKTEVIDYTMMLSDIIDILEKPRYEIDILRIQDTLNKMATSEDMSTIADWLKAILEKKYPEMPEFQFDKYGRLKVNIDKIGGGSGGSVAVDSVVNSSGDNVPPATEANQDILARYRISDIDDPYYGYLDKDGNWYIMKMDGISARYSRGDSDYATNWANRLSLTYDYFDAIF